MHKPYTNNLINILQKSNIYIWFTVHIKYHTQISNSKLSFVYHNTYFKRRIKLYQNICFLREQPQRSQKKKPMFMIGGARE